MAKSHLKLVTPASVNRTVVTPLRLPNKKLRTREHLDQREVERLIKAAGNNRHGHRDSSMVLIAFRHGLRASELLDLRWDQVDFAGAVLHVRRVKNGTSSTHPLVHPHMLRHACGFALANQGVDTRSLQAYLGHRHIQNTVRYAELSPGRFKNFWRDN